MQNNDTWTFFIGVKTSSTLEDLIGCNFFKLSLDERSNGFEWTASPWRFHEKSFNGGFWVVGRVDLLCEDEMREVLVVGTATSCVLLLKTKMMIFSLEAFYENVMKFFTKIKACSAMLALAMINWSSNRYEGSRVIHCLHWQRGEGRSAIEMSGTIIWCWLFAFGGWNSTENVNTLHPPKLKCTRN